MNVQGLVDTINKAGKDERSRYHLTLGNMIDELETVDDHSKLLMFDFNSFPSNPQSYRGYYSDLAFGRSSESVTVGEMLDHLRDKVLDKEFEGYKGGSYIMDRKTPLWVSEWGDCESIALFGIFESEGVVHIATKRLED